MTSAETLEFFPACAARPTSHIATLLIDRSKLDTGRKIRAPPKGSRQKVQLIAALATRAGLLLLDKPTIGLVPAQSFRAGAAAVMLAMAPAARARGGFDLPARPGRR
jgi:ABC-type multidrug transport system ATPase subunit